MANFELKDAVLNFGTLLSMEPTWPDSEFMADQASAHEACQERERSPLVVPLKV